MSAWVTVFTAPGGPGSADEVLKIVWARAVSGRRARLHKAAGRIGGRPPERAGDAP